MGITTEYKCDKCGHTQENPKEMWEVAITRRALDAPSMNAGLTRQPLSQMWCRACMELVHILPPTGDRIKLKELPPEPTLEELVREIVREEIANA